MYDIAQKKNDINNTFSFFINLNCIALCFSIKILFVYLYIHYTPYGNLYLHYKKIIFLGIFIFTKIPLFG